MDAAGGEPWPLTSSPTGVGRYEWSKDSTRVAYVAAEPEPEEEARQKQEKTFVVRAGLPGRPTRLFVQEADGGAPRTLSPAEHYVSSFDWSPDGKTLVYSASEAGEYLENWRSRLYTISAEGGAAGGPRRPRRDELRAPLFPGRPLRRLHLDRGRAANDLIRGTPPGERRGR